MLLCMKTRKTHRNYHQDTFKLAYIHKTIDYVHQIRSKSSRDGTEICYVQNQHLPNLTWFQSACQQWKSFFDKHEMKAIGQLLEYPIV